MRIQEIVILVSLVLLAGRLHSRVDDINGSVILEESLFNTGAPWKIDIHQFPG